MQAHVQRTAVLNNFLLVQFYDFEDFILEVSLILESVRKCTHLLVKLCYPN